MIARRRQQQEEDKQGEVCWVSASVVGDLRRAKMASVLDDFAGRASSPATTTT
jgi:hypothetical protein